MKPTAGTTVVQLTTTSDWRLAIVAASELSASTLDRSADWRVNPDFGPPGLRDRRREFGSYPWPRSRRSRKVALAASS